MRSLSAHEYHISSKQNLFVYSFNICVFLQLIFEAIPKDETDQARSYRGFIAIDDILFRSGSSCKGHCNFDSGLCSFTNDDDADFEWKVVSPRRRKS